MRRDSHLSLRKDAERRAGCGLQAAVVALAATLSTLGCSSTSDAGPLFVTEADTGTGFLADYDETRSFGMIVLRSSTDDPVRILSVEAGGGTNHESIELGGVLVADESRGIAWHSGGVGFPPADIDYELSPISEFVWTPDLDAEDNSRPVGLELMLEITLRRPASFAVIDAFRVNYVLESDPDDIRRLLVTGRALMLCGPEISSGGCSPELTE